MDWSIIFWVIAVAGVLLIYVVPPFIKKYNKAVFSCKLAGVIMAALSLIVLFITGSFS